MLGAFGSSHQGPDETRWCLQCRWGEATGLCVCFEVEPIGFADGSDEVLEGEGEKSAVSPEFVPSVTGRLKMLGSVTEKTEEQA